VSQINSFSRSFKEQADEPRRLSAPRLAILPFATGPYTPERLGTTISEEAIAELASNGQDRATLLARDTAFQLAERGLSPLEVGRTLGANLALAGSVLSLGAHFRLRAEMIRVADGAQIWVEDLVAPQDQPGLLALTLVDRLLFRLGAKKRVYSKFKARPTAFDLNPTGIPKDGQWDSYMQQRLHSHRIQEGQGRLSRVAEMERRQERAASAN
jgi:TolB-like protein